MSWVLVYVVAVLVYPLWPFIPRAMSTLWTRLRVAITSRGISAPQLGSRAPDWAKGAISDYVAGGLTVGELERQLDLALTGTQKATTASALPGRMAWEEELIALEAKVQRREADQQRRMLTYQNNRTLLWQRATTLFQSLRATSRGLADGWALSIYEDQMTDKIILVARHRETGRAIRDEVDSPSFRDGGYDYLDRKVEGIYRAIATAPQGRAMEVSSAKPRYVDSVDLARPPVLVSAGGTQAGGGPDADPRDDAVAGT